MTKANEEKTGLTGSDKSQGDLQDSGGIKKPEGLERERKGPLNKDHGRNTSRNK